MIERKYQVRLSGLVLIMGIAFSGLGIRLAYLHLGPCADRRTRINKTRRLEKDLSIDRATILDCNGNILALDIVKKEVCADPSVIVSNHNVRAVASYLGKCLQTDPDILLKRLDCPCRRFVYVEGYGRTITDKQAKAISMMNFPGIFLNDVRVRSYPRGQSMCHVIGYVNLAGQGSAGIEQEWDNYIRGIPGLLVSEKDGRRRELYDRRRLEISPMHGADVKLTIDQYIQYIVEKALDCAVKEQDARAAWAIVERVRTGEILAMASSPAFDLNDFRKARPDQMRNRCIANIYEPGSTFKVAVVSAALNEGVVTPSQIFDCERGIWFYHGRPLRDYRPHNKLSVADIIKKSSNIGAAKIALVLGNERFDSYLRAFGIGKKTGIGLPGEEAGILRPVEQWSVLSPTRIAIGHEVAVTALQMLDVMCAIANDGVLMKPYVVQQVVKEDGHILFQQHPLAVGRPISPKTAAIMKKLLARVTEQGGTGWRAGLEGYTVAGKTGTAQKAIAGGYSPNLNIASFVGFVPAEDPQIAIIVVIDEPKKRFHTGGAVAAPVFKQIAQQSVRYLDILPVSATASARSVKLEAIRKAF